MINQDNINTFKKVFTSLDEDEFFAMKDCFAEEVKWDYTQLGGIKESITSAEILNQLSMLRGFDSTKHELSNIKSEGDKVSGDIKAIHFLNTLEGIVTGTYKVEFNKDHKIIAWSIVNAKLTGDKNAFAEAAKKVAAGHGKKLK